MTDQQQGAVLGGGVRPASQLSADINAGFAFFLDCVVNLFVLSGVLIGAFGFPAEIIFSKIIPGAITGILAGNLVFVWLAKKAARETGNDMITAIPLGMDLPTVFGMVFFIIGPFYLANVADLGEIAAATKAWHLGMASALWMGFIKIALSFFARAMQREIPQMALIGSMAGIAIVWLGAEAVFGIFALPEIGILALMLMAFALIAGHQLPFNMPGAVMAIFAGTLLYYILAFAGAGDDYVIRSAPALTAALPVPTFAGFAALTGDVTNYLGIIFPFALLIAASSVNVVTGAKVIGDQFDPAVIIRADSGATIISALFGGVVQTTPYFGHPTYKRMGALTNYSIGAASVIAIGGFAGVIAFASQMIPEAVLKPILVVVASDIVRLAFSGGDVRHAPALLFATIPGILNYAHTKVSDLYGRLQEETINLLGADWTQGYILLGAMSKGYILTSLIWGAMIVWIIDKNMKRAACAALVAAVCTSFGVIHSVSPDAGMYLPWAMPDLSGTESLPVRLASGYMIAAVLLFSLGFVKTSDEG